MLEERDNLLHRARPCRLRVMGRVARSYVGGAWHSTGRAPGQVLQSGNLALEVEDEKPLQHHFQSALLGEARALKLGEVRDQRSQDRFAGGQLLLCHVLSALLMSALVIS